VTGAGGPDTVTPAESLEIESALRAAPDVRSAVVARRPSLDGGTRLVGYVIGPDPRSGGARVQRAVAAQLPESLVPHRVVVVDRLPLTPDGEFDLDALPPPDELAQVAPPTPVEEAIALIFTELLDVAEVGPQDGFFALGGSSILATRLAARIRAELDVEVSLVDVLAAPTVAELAELVTGPPPVELPPVELPPVDLPTVALPAVDLPAVPGGGEPMAARSVS
jgi:hypothetical protein